MSTSGLMHDYDRLPSVEQLTTASERAVLALLEVTLELTARALQAEHPMLEEHAYRGSGEPPPAQEALAASVVILATSLREVIAGYCDMVEHIHGDRNQDRPF